MTIRSTPTNALVMLDGQEIGHTPCSVPFHYYGNRQIRLFKDGYETLTVNQEIRSPWYSWPGIDFVSEVLIPWRIRDDREYVYAMSPTLVTSTDDLLGRANDVRSAGQNPPDRVLRRAGVPPVNSTDASVAVPAVPAAN